MLSLPKINTGDYEETLSLLLGEAERLSRNGGGWRNLSDSSPLTAITELLTFIALTQRENMNKISARVLFRLGKLFGELPMACRPATALAEIIGVGRVKKGDRFRLGNVAFEAETDAEINDNELCFIGTQSEGETVPLCAAPNALPTELFRGSDNVILGFKKPFDPEKSVNLTFCLESFGKTGLPALDSTAFDCGTRLSFEYYGEKNGETGWHPVCDFVDDTLSLLRTGTVAFRVDGTLLPFNSVYAIRIIAEQNRFDRLPIVNGIFTSTVRLVQTETLCRTLDFTRTKFRENKMYYSAYIPADAVSELYLLTNDGYITASDIGVNYKIKDSKGADRLITSSRNRIADELFAALPEEREDGLLRLVIYEKPFIRDVLKFHPDGSAYQSQELGFSGAVPNGITALSSNGSGHFSEWHYRDGLDGAKNAEHVFDVSENRLLFGDNLSGTAPFGNDLRITSLALTLGERGNLPQGELVSERQDLSARLITPSSGGTDEESAAEFFARVLDTKRHGTMLSERDFCERAMMTPGLLLRDAHAYSDGGGVTVVVDPDIPSFEEHRADYGYYLTDISNYMKEYKPLGLNLKVIFPIYIGVEIKTEVSGSLDSKELEASLAREAESFFANLTGSSAEYSELHKRISDVRGVTSIHGLTIDAESVHVRKTSDGGLAFPQFVRLKLKRCIVNVSREY